MIETLRIAELAIVEAAELEFAPGLNVLFLECGTLWVPYWIERIDAERREYRSNQGGRLASEIFRDRCFVTTEVDDHFLPTVVSLIGDDNILLSTDYPHDESRFPRSKELFLAQPISEATREKIGRTNALRAYPRL